MEANFDGIVGPTHNYAGLSVGNIASHTWAGDVANPRAAALQGLAKARALADMGLWQAVLPPHERPHIPTLRRLGFGGTDAQVLERAARDAPGLLSRVSSASAMWTANAATVAPSADTADGRVHLTPANLVDKLHRAIEPPTTTAILRAVFGDTERFVVHDPLPSHPELGDEGAANHTRLCASHADRGVHLFVYGRAGATPSDRLPKRYPARQTREASEAVARLHSLDPTRVVFAQQHPRAIDAGVFHNDVISVGNEGVFLYHAEAFVDTPAVIERLRERVGDALCPVEVQPHHASLQDAVSTYLFNTQIVTLPSGRMAIIAPTECTEHDAVRRTLRDIADDDANPIDEVHVFDLRQSMRNGGGPACLRLRVPLTEAERDAVAPRVWLTPQRYSALVAWVERYYRDRLAPDDLRDPALLDESRTALDTLTAMLGLGSVYEFQRSP